MKALYFDNSLPKIAALKLASLVDKYAALGPLSPVRFAQVPEPALPNDRWLKVRNVACGLCGTDIHFIFMDMDPRSFSAATPGIARKFLGHELVAEIVEVGADVGDWRVGQRVTMRIDWPSCFQMEIDPPCRQCAAGNYMLCENLGKKPLPLRDVGGGFSTSMVMHRTQPFAIPPELSLDRALLLEPTASALHGVKKATVAPGDKVLVIGAGTIGLLTVALLRQLAPEADIACLARYPFQADAATKLGATRIFTGGKEQFAQFAAATDATYARGMLGNEILLGGFDVIYDTIGNDATVNMSLRCVRGGGQVVLLGINFSPGKIDYSPIWNQEIRVTGINCHATEATGQTSFELAADLLKKPDFAVESLITHRFPLDRYKDAVKAFTNKRESKAVKIVLEHPAFA